MNQAQALQIKLKKKFNIIKAIQSLPDDQLLALGAIIVGLILIILASLLW